MPTVQKKNHLASVCEARVCQLEIEPDGETKVMSSSFDITQSEQDAVNVVNPRGNVAQWDQAAIYAILRIQNRPVHFQIDTGTSYNIIRPQDLKQCGQVTLEKTS